MLESGGELPVSVRAINDDGSFLLASKWFKTRRTDATHSGRRVCFYNVISIVV